MATISHMKEEMVRLHLTWNLKCLNEIVRKYEPSDSLSRGPLVYASGLCSGIAFGPIFSDPLFSTHGGGGKEHDDVTVT